MDTDNSVVIAAGGGWAELEEGEEGINSGGQRLDLGW